MSKIHKPAKIDTSMMTQAGEAVRQSHNLDCSDKQLGQSIAVLEGVVAYLGARKDCGLLVRSLVSELVVLEDYKTSRESK